MSWGVVCCWFRPLGLSQWGVAVLLTSLVETGWSYDRLVSAHNVDRQGPSARGDGPWAGSVTPRVSARVKAYSFAARCSFSTGPNPLTFEITAPIPIWFDAITGHTYEIDKSSTKQTLNQWYILECNATNLDVKQLKPIILMERSLVKGFLCRCVYGSPWSELSFQGSMS